MNMHIIILVEVTDNFLQSILVTSLALSDGSGDGLLPDGNQPLPESMVTSHQWGPMVFASGQAYIKSSTYLTLITTVPADVLACCSAMSSATTVLPTK